MANRYWVGGTGTWNTVTTTNWSTASNGSGGASAPTSADDVFIDTFSGTGTITCTAGVCNNLTVTASQAIILGAASSTLSVYGNLSLPSGGSFSASTNVFTITFAATSTGKTITSNGKSLYAVVFNGVGGGWSLQDDFFSSSFTSSLTLTNGSFNANNFNVNMSLGGSFNSNNSNTRTLTMGSGTWTIAGSGTPWNITTTTGLTFNANTSTITLTRDATGTVTFAGGGLTYYNLSFAGSVGTMTYALTGANTFNQISSSRTNAYTITLPSSTTTTVGTWTASGSSGNLLTLNSSTAGTAATLAVTSSPTVNYATITDVNLSVLNAATATNSQVINSNNWQIATTSSRWAFLTTGTSWTSPSDWATTAISNIHVIGGGGGGSGSINTSIAGGAGGGGGGYTKSANIALAASTSYTYAIGAAGAGAAGTTTTSTGGTGGTSSFTMPVTYVSSATSVQNTAATTITVTVPSVSNGNLMVMILISRSVGVSWTTPAGWTASSASAGKAIFYKTASSEPASYTVTQSTAQTASAFIIAYSNATFDTAGAFSANLSPAQPAAITVAQSNSTIVYFVGRDSAISTTYTTPTGYTARQADSDATAPSAALFDLAGVAAGSYTAPTSTPSTSNASSVVIAIKPTLYQATGGTGGSATSTPTSVAGAGGVGSGGLVATPTYKTSQLSTQITNSTTITVTVPTVTNGDLMVMVVNSGGASATTWTTPSGWTAGPNNGTAQGTFWRIASSEPASYTVTQSGSNAADGSILIFSGATFDTAGTPSATSSSLTPSAITVATNNSTILYVVYDSAASRSPNAAPTGYTTIISDGDANAPSQFIYSLSGVSAGSYTGPTVTTTGNMRAFTIALSSIQGYTGGAGGTGAITGTTARPGGAGGGAAGPAGNGGKGGNGYASGGVSSGSGGGGGNGGGTAGSDGTVSAAGTGGNTALGVRIGGNGNTAGGGGAGIDGIDIVTGVYGGGGGGGGGYTNGGAAGSYGAGGGGAGVNSATVRTGGSGTQGAIFIGYTGTYVAPVSTGNFFFMFM